MTLASPGDFPEMTVHDAMMRHLLGCEQCMFASRRKTSVFERGEGFTKAGYCSEWFEILQEFADWEGMVNKDTLFSEQAREDAAKALRDRRK